jgi:hypothetical protein
LLCRSIARLSCAPAVVVPGHPDPCQLRGDLSAEIGSQFAYGASGPMAPPLFEYRCRGQCGGRNRGVSVTLAPAQSDEAHSPASRGDQRQSSAKHDQLNWTMIPDQPHAADERRQDHQRERQPAVEAHDL